MFYVWINCYGVIAPVQAWTFAHSLFDTRQARRLFGLVASGATVGALAGGLLARVLVEPVGGTVNLMRVLAALIGLAAGIVRVAGCHVSELMRQGSEGRLAAPFRRTLAEIAGSRYLRLIAGLLAVVSIVTQSAQFQFSLAAVEWFDGDADRLTAFFGEFNFYLGLLALVVQLTVAGPALRRFGIGLTILVLPIALLLGSSLVVMFPVLWAILVMSGLDQSIRFSVDKATFELLYLPLPTGVRVNVKATIDMIISRLADGVGSILLDLATQGFSLYVVTLPGVGLGIRGLAAINVVLIGGWIAVALALRRGYVETITESIREHRLDAERASAALFDRSIAELLNAQLTNENPEEILYALSLLESQRRHIPDEAVQFLLRHPTSEVRRGALTILRTTSDPAVLPQVERLLQDLDLQTRANALLYLAPARGDRSDRAPEGTRRFPRLFDPGGGGRLPGSPGTDPESRSRRGHDRRDARRDRRRGAADSPRRRHICSNTYPTSSVATSRGCWSTRIRRWCGTRSEPLPTIGCRIWCQTC